MIQQKMLPLTSRLDMLPHDLLDLIRKHHACMVIQDCVRRRHTRRLLFGHSALPFWKPLRAALVEADILLRVYPYAHVRKEWNQEPFSWFSSLSSFDELADEITQSTTFWGHPHPLLVRACSRR